MDKKESRVTVLYVRIRQSNDRWVRAEMKRLRFKSKSEYIDCLIQLAREGKKRQRDRHP